MHNLRNRALRYRELASDIVDESVREEILRLAAEYERRAELMPAAAVEAQPSR